MLAKFVIFTVFISVACINGYNCEADKRSYEGQLKCYLNSNPNLLSPPTKATQLFLHGVITYIDFNIEDGTLLLMGGVYMVWMFERQIWDPEKFGDLFSLEMESESIGLRTPQLILNNHLFRKEELHNEIFGRSREATIGYNGYTEITSSMTIYTRCDDKANTWPWNPHKCCLNFTVDIPNMEPYLRGMPEAELEEVTSLWKIADFKYENNADKLNIEITIEMKNRSLQIASCLTFIAVSLVMLSSFLISTTSSIKLASKISSLLLLTIYLLMLMNSIPNFTLRACNFLIGFVMLLLTMGVSCCITAYIVRLVKQSQSYHPSLIMKFTNSKENECLNDAMQTILSEDFTPMDNDYTTPAEDSLSKKSHKEWLKTATIIEYLSFAISLIIVIILMKSLLA